VWKQLPTSYLRIYPETGKVTKLKRNLLINGGFVLALALLATIGWLNYLNIKGMNEEERWEHHTYAVNREFDELLSALQAVESGARGFVITGEETFLEPYHAAAGKIEQILSRMRVLTSEDTRHEDSISGIAPLIREKLANAGKIIELRRAAGFQAASRLVVSARDKDLVNEISRQLAVARTEEERLLNTLNDVESARIRKSLLAITAGSFLSFSLLVMVFLLLRREIGQRVKAEEELRKHRDHLEKLVQMRTGLLEEAKREAEIANSAKSVFLTNMSHEMLTPLTGIMGVVDLMLTEELTDRHRYNMEMAKLSAESLKTLINNILDFSRLTTGQMSFERQPFDLHRCVRGVADIFALQAKRKGLRFLLKIDDGVPLRVTGDEGRLRQVLDNLLGNALKFTASGEISVSVQQTHDHSLPGQEVLLFTVRDTGTGIPTGYMDNIFDIFTQADTSSTKKFGGAGLGLALTRQIVANLGGKISGESRPGEGSVFTFTLPLPGEKTESPTT